MKGETGFGIGTGVGLVVASMIGSGVFLASGFMVKTMNPEHILLAWLVGAFLAFCGAVTYAEMSSQVHQSGGEYQYLTKCIHPSLGYLVGFGTILLGFACPMALDSIAAGIYIKQIFQGGDIQILGTVCIVSLCMVHLVGRQSSIWTQNVLAIFKILIVLSIIGIGVSVGTMAPPDWSATELTAGEFPADAFFSNQFWIAYAFSGFNAAVYASGEFKNPKKDVPKAILIGFFIVVVMFVFLNYLFLANLDPSRLDQIQAGSEITLGHMLLEDLLGAQVGNWVSGALVVVFLSSVSVLLMLGPRVLRAMADDGQLPKQVSYKTYTVFLVVVSLSLIWLYGLREIVESVSFIIFLFSGMTAASLLWGKTPQKPSLNSQVAATLYLIGVVGIMGYGLMHSSHLLGLTLIVVGLGMWGWRKNSLAISDVSHQEAE